MGIDFGVKKNILFSSYMVASISTILIGRHLCRGYLAEYDFEWILTDEKVHDASVNIL